MTDDRNIPAGERDLAAEYALGTLTGDDLRRARALSRTDTAFRHEVARWSGRLAPMLEEVTPVAPPASAWTAIQRRLRGSDDDGKVVLLRRRMRRWRGIAVGMTALAACLAVFIMVRPVTPAVPVEVQRSSTPEPLLAMLKSDGQGTTVVANWDPGAQRLVLAVTGSMPSDPTHSHELWVIPPDGKPRSLGTMGSGKQMHMRLADALAQLLQRGAIIAISVEPQGGSPTGAPTGPVVASGALTKA